MNQHRGNYSFCALAFVLAAKHTEDAARRSIEGQDSEFGLGDITQSLFLGPSSPGKVIWGAGPMSIKC